MQTNTNHINILLKRNGTEQSNRYINALNPENIKLHDFSVQQWMQFAFEFAKNINYFNTETNSVNGTWEDFFLSETEIQNHLKLADNSELTPHLSLFLSFLKLIDLSQNRLNQLSKRHLDFYYKRVLNLSNREAIPDQVHLLFELAKNASEVKIDEGTAFDAGKDSSGKKMIYKSEEEFVANKAKVSALKNIFIDTENKVLFSDIANSYDGLGNDFPNKEVKWYPFGHPAYQPNNGIPTNYPKLPVAKLGFSIASPILNLKEGLRTITFTFELEKPGGITMPSAIATDTFEVLLSGEKQWLAANIESISRTISNNTVYLSIVVKIDESLDAIVPYNKEVLRENFTTISPVARFIINKENNDFYKAFKETTIKKINIGVDVKNIRSIQLENDQGILDAKKPFFPFTPTPAKGSNFYVGFEEINKKNWSSVKLGLIWKNTPNFGTNSDHFKINYDAYRNDYLNNLTTSSYTVTQQSSDSQFGGLIVNNSNHFKVDVAAQENGEWDTKLPNHNLFSKETDQSYRTNLSITPNPVPPTLNQSNQLYYLDSTFSNKILNQITGVFGFNKQLQVKTTKKEIKDIINPGGTNSNSQQAQKNTLLKITLKQSFLHELFPKIYAIALSKGKNTSYLIPNDPYTPVIESVSMEYTANTEKTYTPSTDEKILLDSFLNEDIEFFHEHPFGQSEEHSYLKKHFSFLKSTKCNLVPPYSTSELYIGLEDAKNLQQISLLIQVLEGSENPEPNVEFDNDKKLKWYVMTGNEWMELDKNYMLYNNTDNFLRSGIVKLNLPNEATSNNTAMPSGYHWIKVVNPINFDNVCQVLNISAQAVLAEFENNNNSLEHILNGLAAGTISKLAERKALVKGVVQPYNSFGGIPQENDIQYYRRVSERLRHKQRAITIWDYEHLVLEKFPYVFKTNCLKTTDGNKFLLPGYVTLIVIPNIANKNSFDVFKPRLSKTKRNDIATFINKLNTLHVTAKVENPVYVEIKVELTVKFHEGKDENFYMQQLKTDISKFLAPWAFEETAKINFGVSLHQSAIIYYIEKLGYVDYVKDFILFMQNGKDINGNPKFEAVKKAIPANPKVIFTSAKPENHKVTVSSTLECEIV